MSRDSVTTDLAVLQGWPKPTKKVTHFSASEVAAALKLTVFQVTARLKGMEGRGLIGRSLDGQWAKTELGKTETDNPSPSLVAKPKVVRLPSTNGSMVGPPDDSKVPRISTPTWRPSDFAVGVAQEGLPLIERRMAQLKEDPKKNRLDIMRLQTEIDHNKLVLKTAKNKSWSWRTDRSGPVPSMVFVSPDGREYIRAGMFQTADMIMVSKSNGDVRLRLLMTSPQAKQLNKKQVEQAAREQAKKEEQQNARQARVLKAEQEAREEAEAIRHRGHGGSGKKAVQGKVRPASHATKVERGPAKADRTAPKKPDNGRLHKGGDRSGKSAPGRAKDRGSKLHTGAVVRAKKGRK